MSNIPSMKPEQVRFRSPSSSEEYNQTQSDIFHDITNLFNIMNELEQELLEANSAFEISTQFQHMHILGLENRVRELESELDTLKNKTGDRIHRIFAEEMRVDIRVPENERASIDTTHRLVHLPVTGKTISKVYIYDEVAKEVVIPSSLKAEALPKEKTGWLIKENNPLNAFNGNNASYWHRKVCLPLDEVPKEKITCQLEITLPDTMISNRDVNTIYLHPFPINSMKIDKVEYQLAGNWQLLPGWPVDESKEPVSYKYAHNLKFSFPETQMKKIRITMSQTNWFEENSQKVYHFGLQEVGVFYTDYQSEMGRFEVPVVLRGDTTNKIIKGINVQFSNAALLSDVNASFSYNIYTIDEQGQLHYTKDSFPMLVTSDQLLIKGIIHVDQNSGVTPTLEYVELAYEDV